MKKVKLILCLVVAGVSIFGYIFCNSSKSGNELITFNVEALSQDESSTIGDCVDLPGICVTPEASHQGMRYSD